MSKWNPWPEVPAPEGTHVLVTIKENSLLVIRMAAFWQGRNIPDGTWMASEGFAGVDDKSVIAWMPLPKPYKGNKK